MVTIIQDFIPVGSKNRPGRRNPMKYITIHNTGNSGNGANAKSHAKYIKSPAAVNAPASWHYTVDDEFIVHHVPDNENAWHCADGTNGTGNNQSIGIEICMNADGDLLKATDNAAELTAHLMKKYKIPIQNVVQHNHWSGKNCPQMIRSGKPYDWKTFLEKVSTFTVQSADRTKVQLKAGLDNNTMKYLDGHPFRDALYKKLADAMK